MRDDLNGTVVNCTDVVTLTSASTVIQIINRDQSRGKYNVCIFSENESVSVTLQFYPRTHSTLYTRQWIQCHVTMQKATIKIC